jgi:hypothetical protein
LPDDHRGAIGRGVERRQAGAEGVDQVREEVLGGGGDQLRLGREVLEEGTLRDAGPAADRGRGEARVTGVDELLDRGVQQAAARRPPALGLGPARRATRAGRRSGRS